MDIQRWKRPTSRGKRPWRKRSIRTLIRHDHRESNLLSKLYIWKNRALFMGYLPDISEHRLGSAALCVGIDQPFRVLESESDGWRESRSVLVPPGCLHEIQVGGALMAILFIEPESSDYPAIQNLMLDGEWQCLYGLAHEDEVLAVLSEAWERQPDATVIHDLLERLIPPPRPEDRPRPLDRRIQRVIRLITALAAPGWIPEDVAPDARLVDDLGFDSVRLIELTMNSRIS